MKLLKTAIIAASLVLPVQADEIETLLIAEANRYNKNLPIQIDSETRIDTVLANGHNLNYLITTSNYESKDFDAEVLQKKMRPIMGNRVCTNPDISSLLNAGISFQYTYYGKLGKYITSVKFTKLDCQPSI